MTHEFEAGEILVGFKSELATDLFKIGVIKFDGFTLKSGRKSPFYVDLRLLSSHPEILQKVADAYLLIMEGLKFDRIAAVPYAAIPIGTAISLTEDIPLIYLRKEEKGYGLRKEIEGEFVTGDKVLVIDDLITTGESKIEVIKPLREAGLVIENVVVLIDREQGGKETLASRGYTLHAFWGIRELFTILLRGGQLSQEIYNNCLTYLSDDSNRA